MLVASINPPAKKVLQTTPFTTEEITAPQMITKCSRLVIGNSSETIEFDISFGEVYDTTNPDGSIRPMFKLMVHHNLRFTHSELADWGTDDSFIYYKIAERLGFQITSLTEVPELNFGN